jgi:hypothetical protein
MLLNILLSKEEAVVVQEAMEHYIDGLITAYQKDLRSKLGLALSAEESIDNSIDDSNEETDND